MTRIAIIQGHPDPAANHFAHAAALAYEQGARSAGHEVRHIHVAALNFVPLRTKEDWETGTPAADIHGAQQTIAWAQHLVIFYPLWLGCMPALLKGFLEQALRPGFAVPAGDRTRPGAAKPLAGRSAHVVVTMGMPGFVYKWYFGAYSLKILKRNILAFCGIAPVRTSVIGMIEGKNPAARTRWLERLATCGRTAA